MRKQNKLVLTSLLMLGLVSCQAPTSEQISSSSSFAPTNDLQTVFNNMKGNNFSVDYTDSYANFGNVERNEKYYYTPYSLQSEGDLGFAGYAQSEDLIFPYTISDNQIVSGLPMINSYNGIRYDSLYDFTYGFQNFDISELPTEKDNDGFYNYTFGDCTINDNIIMTVLLHYSVNSVVYPTSVKFKVVANTLIVDSIVHIYDITETELYYDTCKSIVYDIGKTENTLIKTYLNDGKSSKTPLDNRFIKFINPYLNSNNYKIDLDASGLNQSFSATEIFTDDAMYFDAPGTANDSGFIMTDGAVSTFTLNETEDKLNIVGTPFADSDGNFYTSIYGDIFTYKFSDLYFNNMIGYVDDKNENIYHLTDALFVSTLAYLSYIELSDEFSASEAIIEILDDETGEFEARFEIYNKTTNSYLGQYRARFYDLNQTSIPAADRYLNKGDDPHNQSKNDLAEVLELFDTNNYSMDSLTSAGLAKCYFTENYFYEECYQDNSKNVGYIKQNGAIYQFYIEDSKVVVDTTKNFADGTSPMVLPGCGSRMFSANSVDFTSTLTSEIYDYENYEIVKFAGISYWQNTSTTFSSTCFNYVFGQQALSQILPMGSGFKVSKGEDSYDTRVTFYSTYTSLDATYEGYYSYTYYDLGNTSNSIIDSYLNTL